MKNFLLTAIIAIGTINFSQAQYQKMPQSELLWQIQKLGNVGSVLYVAAHPDDENTKLISYLSKEKQLRVGYLSLTRGDGGQNLIGAEQGIDLGVIRTNELLAARKKDGGHQYFTRAYDFGYSKSPEETFRQWDKHEMLKDVVEVIRYFKPDVIVCRFPTTGEGGHGHHTASAILAEEAFSLANNPNYEPSQVKNYGTWQAKRLLFNTFNFNQEKVDRSNQIPYEVGSYNALLGQHIAEIASESRSQHKSQGFGAAAIRGTSPEYFKLIKGDTLTQDLLEKVNIQWSRFPFASGIQKQVQQIVQHFNKGNHALCVQQLIVLKRELQKLKQQGNKEFNTIVDFKVKEIDQIMIQISGIWMDLCLDKPTYAIGEKASGRLEIVKTSNMLVELINMEIDQNKFDFNHTIDNNILYKDSFSFESKKINDGSPYWLKNGIENNLFNIKNEAPHFLAEKNTGINGKIKLKIMDEVLELNLPATYRFVDPVKGELYQPARILPQAEIILKQPVVVLAHDESITIQVSFLSLQDELIGDIIIEGIPENNYEISEGKRVVINKKGSSITKSIILKSKNFNDGIHELKIGLKVGNNTISNQYTKIDYDHIPHQLVAKPAVVKVVKEAIKITHSKIAFVPGAGEQTFDILKNLGLNIEILNPQDISAESLKGYQTVLMGIRAFNVHEILFDKNDILNKFIEGGGKLVVQYNTNSRVGPLKGKIGPYAFDITRNRVTDETAAMTILQPEHPLFRSPNQLNGSDFNYWIQERGIYFADKYEPHYQSLLSMADFNESPLKGALIEAKYGKGNIIYTGLALFRQLPAGAPSAYKLLMNMLN